ncbi:UNVERIFIED_CONTAM: Fibrocystin-L [Siphonaria sp. JEL0065]|nr:Fibrocystin-L [Siphonaria sp. JEL0065]
MTSVPPPIVKGIVAQNNGTLDIHGQVYAPTWTRLSVTARKGDSQILIQDLVNWEPGQSIVITTTATKDSRDFNRNDVSVIKNITVASGIGSSVSVVALEKPLQFDHYGGSEYQAEVGLLSRRIVIKGDDVYSNLTDSATVCVGDYVSAVSTNPCGAPKGYGGHVQIIGSGIGRVRGVEFFQMGQTNVMGRYPYHIHMAKENGRNSYLDSSSIHQSFFRCMSVHASHNVTVSKNVAFDITGNCFYIEDGVEEDNIFKFNLAAHVHFLGAPTNPSNYWGQYLDTVWESPDLIVPTDVAAAPFYITNPYNSFIGNAASGGWAGYSFPNMPAPTGLSANVPLLSPSSRPLKVFEGNSAHSTGFWWNNGGGIYVGGLFQTEANGSLSYNPGRSSTTRAQTCNVPLTSLTQCSSLAWMRFNNTKVFLSNRGIMHWGNRVEVVKYEGHDCGISANVFGQVWIDKMLSICRTNNTLVPYISGCSTASTAWWKCASRDSSFWSQMLGFQWYDTGQNHIISNTTFRTCTNAWKPALQTKSMAVWMFLTHSDQFVPGIMQATRNIVYQNCNSSQLWVFNNYQRTTVSGRLQSWLDMDGTASLSSGRTMIGSLWGQEWWNLFGSPKCRLAPANMTMWLCTDNQMFEASLYLTADPSKTSLIGASQCSNGNLAINCPIIGYASHGATKNITQGLPLTINTQITGPVEQNGGQWFVQYYTGSPVNLVVSRIQFPSESNSLVLVLPYPSGTTFNVTANAASWCYATKKNICKQAYNKTASFSQFQNLSLASGNAYFFDDASGLLYVNILQLSDNTLGTNGVFNRSLVNPSTFTRVGISLNTVAWSANLVIAAGCASVDGVYCKQSPLMKLSPPVTASSTATSIRSTKFSSTTVSRTTVKTALPSSSRKSSTALKTTKMMQKQEIVKMAVSQTSSSKLSKKSTALEERNYLRPRFALLLSGFVAICAVTVGVLGWQLTMSAGKSNVSTMIEEIEFLIANQIANYFVQAGDSLTEITAMQAEMFSSNEWSLSSPKRAQDTYKAMMIALKGMQQYTTSMYLQEYPAGLQTGYFYHTDSKGNSTLRWWSQTGTAVSVYLCTLNGTLIQPPLSVENNPGDGTLENPGNNNTLQNAIGGTQGADLDYSLPLSFGYSNVYVWDGVLYKTSFAHVLNPITNERVTFGNDWTLTVISKAITGMLEAVSFSMFAAVVEANTGRVLATSSSAALFSGDSIYTIQQINDPFFQDFSAVSNSSFGGGNSIAKASDLPTLLSHMWSYLNATYPGSQSCYIDRTIAGATWRLSLNTYTLLGNPMIFVIYMNIDSVEMQLNQMSIRTGYMILGIILAFLLLGFLFTLLITRQINVVSKQMKLLEKLDFEKVAEMDRKPSFIYEVAELEACFHGMVDAFSTVLKTNASFRQASRATGHTGAGAMTSETPVSVAGSEAGRSTVVR